MFYDMKLLYPFFCLTPWFSLSYYLLKVSLLSKLS